MSENDTQPTEKRSLLPEKVQADLKNPPPQFRLVNPDEEPGREDQGYVGVSPEYTARASEVYKPVEIEPGSGSSSSTGDDTPTYVAGDGRNPVTPVSQEDAEKEAAGTTTTVDTETAQASKDADNERTEVVNSGEDADKARQAKADEARGNNEGPSAPVAPGAPRTTRK